MRKRGVPLDRRYLAREPAIVGDLLVEEIRDAELGRTIRQARLSGLLPKDVQVVPPLRCAELFWMGPDGFVLGGLERDGTADYAQSWWCRPG